MKIFYKLSKSLQKSYSCVWKTVTLVLVFYYKTVKTPRMGLEQHQRNQGNICDGDRIDPLDEEALFKKGGQLLLS